jgi:hypothetical protein
MNGSSNWRQTQKLQVAGPAGGQLRHDSGGVEGGAINAGAVSHRDAVQRARPMCF